LPHFSPSNPIDIGPLTNEKEQPKQVNPCKSSTVQHNHTLYYSISYTVSYPLSYLLSHRISLFLSFSNIQVSGGFEGEKRVKRTMHQKPYHTLLRRSQRRITYLGCVCRLWLHMYPCVYVNMCVCIVCMHICTYPILLGFFQLFFFFFFCNYIVLLTFIIAKLSS